MQAAEAEAEEAEALRLVVVLPEVVVLHTVDLAVVVDLVAPFLIHQTAHLVLLLQQVMLEDLVLPVQRGLRVLGLVLAMPEAVVILEQQVTQELLGLQVPVQPVVVLVGLAPMVQQVTQARLGLQVLVLQAVALA